EEIRDVTRRYRVFYRKVESAEFSEYLMDHSSFIYLISPGGDVVAMFKYGTGADAIADAIRRHMAS
ncbi:MAG: SCO family protein, partial [Alphaproteobacteria bacterium]